MSRIPNFGSKMVKLIFSKFLKFCFVVFFGLWVKDLALLDLKFGFGMQKSSHGTPPELIWLDSDDITLRWK